MVLAARQNAGRNEFDERYDLSARQSGRLQTLARSGEDEADLNILVEGIKLARKIASQSAFDPYRGSEVWPGDSVQSDVELEEYVREKAQTLYHPVGTCKMGVDSMAVVSPELKVYGVSGLRVVDASIMPTIVNANTHAPIVMIAEKAADMILSG